MKTQIKVYDHKGTFKGILDKQTYSSSFEVDCLKNGGQQTLELQVNGKENLIDFSDFIKIYTNINGEYKLYYSGIVYRFPEGNKIKTIYINGIYEILSNEQYVAGTYSGSVKSLIETMLSNFHTNKIIDNTGVFQNEVFGIDPNSDNGPNIEIEVKQLNCYDFLKKICEIGQVIFYIQADGKILLKENLINKTLNYGKDFQKYKIEISSDDIYNIVTIEGKNETKTYQNQNSIDNYGRILIGNINKSEITNTTTLDNFGQKLVNENSRRKKEIEITHNNIGILPGFKIKTLNLKENFENLIVEKIVLKGTYEIIFIDKYINYGKILGNQI